MVEFPDTEMRLAFTDGSQTESESKVSVSPVMIDSLSLHDSDPEISKTRSLSIDSSQTATREVAEPMLVWLSEITVCVPT